MGEKIIPVEIQDEMKSAYLDYAMSVIIGRALPDVRDGLKPVHRRILYAMQEMGLSPGKPYRKSAGVVGEVLKNYHPHGDIPVYEAIVRLAQDFNCRYPLIDGQGNFGSIDGDPPAAMRYTEIRLTPLAEEMLADIDKETVEFVPNYDNSTFEPSVLPARIPQLLINGSSGIAVGMATNIPPHNISEVVDAIIATIMNKEISIDELIKYIKGPDFPTGGIILGINGIKEAYTTGKGTIIVRGRTKIEKIKEKERIIITEIPYQVNKNMLIEKIAELVREKKIDGITDVRDESDREGTRIVIELARGENSQVILNQLFAHTQLQVSFGIIMLAIVEGKPKVLNLKEIITFYIEHRKNIITRRTEYELKKAQRRIHILEGLKIVLANLSNIIKIIRSSKNANDAKISLIKTYSLTEIQAQAILDMRLQQLTKLEQEKIEQEYNELTKLIEELKTTLSSPKRILDILKEELIEIKNKFSDKRRTEILHEEPKKVSIEELIKEEDVVVILSHRGYIKRSPIEIYKSQKRGGKGILTIDTKEEDFVEEIFITTTHNYILLFTNMGRVYWLKVYEIPESSRYARGKPIVNLVKLKENERITATVSVRSFDKNTSLIMATKFGFVKKTNLEEYSNPRPSGIIAIKLSPNDELIGVKLANENQDIFLASFLGKSIRFPCKEIREIGRSGRGVIGMRLSKNDHLVGIETLGKGTSIITVTENGFVKQTKVEEYRVQKRGGKGIINIKTTPKNGFVVGIREVTKENEIMVITNKGNMIRTKVDSIRETSRATQGVRLIKLENNDKVSGIACIEKENEKN